LEVRRDGVALQEAELGSPIPVDPGEHVIEAAAPGKQPWTSKIQVGSDAAKVSVEIPALQAASGPIASSAAPAVATGSSPTGAPPADKPSSGSGSAMRTTGLVLGGVGVVGIGLGSFFGLQASSKWSDAKGKCLDYPYVCSTEAMDGQSSARSAATLSTVMFVAGGALLATGVVLYFTAPKPESVALGVGPGSAFVKGSF
ncbi:MAG TPA: hypothetical protein VNG33_19580, partial [Polyangiaceae bacterium]|nr:hypothetical protein [Polyangiaceae bacterium]